MKTALVTGSSRGIGAEIAVALAKKGFFVVVHYLEKRREAERVLKAVREFSDGFAVKADLRKSKEVREMFEDIKLRTKSLDVVVNNASRFINKDISMLSEEEWLSIIETNLNGAFFVCKNALEIMRRQKSGKIINIGTATCEHPRANINHAPYLVSKTGILILTRTLASSEAENNIQINMVSPGVVENAVSFPEGFDVSRTTTKGDVVKAVISLLELPEAVTGVNIVVSNGWGL